MAAYLFRNTPEACAGVCYTQFMNRFINYIKAISPIQKISIVLGVCIIIVIGTVVKKQSTTSNTYDVQQIKRGNISEEIIISGNANATGNASVFSPSTGVVDEVYVKNGDKVTAGTELLKIQSTAMEIDRSNALAAYQAAISAADLARQTKTTTQALLESTRKSVIDASINQQRMINNRNNGSTNPATNSQYTQDEIDSINSAYIASKETFSSVEQKYVDSDKTIQAAQSAVAAAYLAYQATLNGVVKAPIDGTIINLSVSKGDYVSAKISTTTATSDVSPILRISTSDAINVSVKLNETDVAKVHIDQKANVVFDAIPDKIFDAIVSRIDTVGVNANAVVTYNAYITLSSNDERIRPTMTATVTIQTDPKQNVLIVPNNALRSINNKPSILVPNGADSTPKEVKIGTKNSTESEIISGASEGDKILVPKSK